MMKTLLCSLVVILSANSYGQVTILQEDFSGLNGSLPAGWTVINGDGLTPNSNVSQFTSAWIIAPDFDNPVDTVAMSTSWYTPAGTSNDWLITPPIALTTNNVVGWEAEAQDAAYPDGYELRISTTTPTQAGFLANPALFTIAAENGAVWTQRSVNLQAAGYANMTVYLAWRNNSTDQFVLMVDDVHVYELASYDVAMDYQSNDEYTITPLAQIGAIGTEGILSNNGSGAITGVTMTVNIVDGGLNTVYNATSSAVASIATGGSATATVPGFTPTVADTYTVTMTAAMNETDGNMANNSYSYTVVVDDSVFARDENVVTGTLGIGAGNGGQLGQAFTLTNPDEITSVTFYMANTNQSLSGQTIIASIYSTIGGVPAAEIATCTPLVMGTATDQLYTVGVVGGSFSLAAGEYVVVVNEPDSTLSLGYSDNIFTSGKTWVNWPTNPLGTWANNEDFGFNKTYILRANFGNACAATGSTITDNACEVYNWNGTDYFTSGMYYDTLVNSNGCDSIVTLDLTIYNADNVTQNASSCSSYTWSADGQTYTATGIYTATLTNSNGCDSTITLNLTIGGLDNTTSLNVYTITANQTNATYQWIDCDNGNAPIAGETNQSFTATANGNYAVIVTDGPCVDTSSCVAITTIGIEELATKNGIAVQPNPSNGAFEVIISGLATENAVLTLTDASGKQIESRILKNENSVSINGTTLNAGIYFITIETGNDIYTERVVIIE